jgi:hypothetical protein
MNTDLKNLEDDAVMGSERSFGLVFAALFALIALLLTMIIKSEQLNYSGSGSQI